ENLEFLAGSMLDVPIEGESRFDLVVCFEALEHVREHEKVLGEIRRLVAPDGILIISTPNTEEYGKQSPGFSNPFHVKELSIAEFSRLLSHHFGKVQILGQKVLPSSFLFSLDSPSAARNFLIRRGEERFESAQPVPGDAMYFIGVCSGGEVPLPSLESALADASGILFDQRTGSVVEEREFLKQSLARAEAEIRGMTSTSAKKSRELERLRFECARLRHELDGVRGKLKENEALNRKAREDLERQEAQIRDLSLERLKAFNDLEVLRSSLMWKVLHKTQGAKDKALPTGTARRKWFNRFTKSVKIIGDKGLKGFAGEYRNYRADRRLLREQGAPRPPGELEEWKGQGLTFPEPPLEPEVSIVITVHDKVEYNYHCLKSILENTRGSYEVVVVDNASTDSTPALLDSVANIRRFRNEENEGFVLSSNRGVRESRGKYVFLLNNDTVVREDWLDPLLKVMSREDVGAAGSKLVYPDSRLQEAGGIIWSDASGWNYGKFDDPEDCRYNFVREVDYCSGAALMVRRDLWMEIGGFDERLVPGYYEDTDICFALRERGFKVLYQPKSVITHFEGVTCGTDTTSGIKKYQEINKGKFRDKWEKVLDREHLDSGDVDLPRARVHGNRTRILVVDHYVPTFDRDAGSLRMFGLLKLLTSRGYSVSFVGDNLAKMEPYTEILQQMGVEVLYFPYVKSIEEYLAEAGSLFDLVVLSRSHIAKNHVSSVITHCRGAKIVFDTVDLQFLRKARQAEVAGDPVIRREAEEYKRLEFQLARSCDVTFVVSDAEREILTREDPTIRVEVLPTIHDVVSMEKDFEDKENLLFIGGFNHPPNEDGVVWFVEDIFPRIKDRIPEVSLTVIGSEPTVRIRALESKDVVVTGYVEDIEPFFQKARLFVCPLRYGAGIKGKINQAMGFGLPVVTTAIGAEGIGLVDGENALIADDPEDFARKVVRVYNDENEWRKISVNSMRNVEEKFSPSIVGKKLFEVLESLIPRPAGEEPPTTFLDGEDQETVSVPSKYEGPRAEFSGMLEGAKGQKKDVVEFYPHSTLSNLLHIDELLSSVGLSAEDVLRAPVVNDIGGGDGDLAFYSEFLGSERVSIVDFGPTNFNNLKGARELKKALNSEVHILETDLDVFTGWENVKPSETCIFLGILYHLRNPVFAMTRLAEKTKSMIMSTKVFDVLHGQDCSRNGLGYFYYEAECNDDASNWWCFTDEGLQRLINRTGWEIVSYERFGCRDGADPVSLDGDGRAFAYLRSRK
ncbi:MAG: glycosyltransferase, partial [Planctomycetota bacterium]